MFELRTFGGVALLRDGLPETGPGIQRRRLAVLVQLAVAGELGVSREKLIARLWPDSTEDTARRGLAQSLYGLRRALGDDRLIDGTSVLRLNASLMGSDVRRFSDAIVRGDLVGAVGEYSGPFLDGFHISDGAEFEHWVADERQRLQREYARVLESLAEDAGRRGDHAAGAEWWRRRAAMDPLDGRVGARFMEALHASGDLAAALQYARVHDALIHEELGESTASPLVELGQRLRSRPVGERSSPTAAPATPAEATPTPPTPALPTPTPVTLAPEPSSPARPISEPAADTVGPRSMRRWALVAGLVLAVAIAGTAWIFARRPDDGVVIAEGGHTTLAVLPFVTLTPGPDLDFLRIGIADAIITQLANARELRVRPTSAILTFDTQRVDARRAGRALSAEYVLTGTVQDVGSRLRVSVQLIGAGDGTPRWGERYELSRSDLFALQDSVAQRVVDALPVRLSAAERERLFRRYTDNTAAYEAYLRGRSYLARHTEAGTRAAMRAFSEALAFDSAYALAWAGLGMASAEMHLRFASGASVNAWRDSAQQQTLRALALDSSLAEVHQSLAAVARKSDFDWERTISESRRAIALSPSLELPHYYIAGAFYHLGLLDEAEREVRIGVDVNPAGDQLERLLSHGVTSLLAGRYQDALEALEQADRLGDRSISGTYLAEAQYYAGHRAEAEAILRELVASGSVSTAARARAVLASIVAAAGSRDEARALVQSVEAGDYVGHHVAYSIGAAHAQLGDPRAAVRWLERAAATGFPCYPWYTRDPLLAPLQSDSGFKRLLDDLRATTERARRRYAAPPSGGADLPA
jgi:TolB-like protein/DNA-binding SARP family transcriptional activator